VPDEAALIDVSVKLSSQDIPYQLFTEPDINNENTALCTHALPRGYRKFFKKYQLWG